MTNQQEHSKRQPRTGPQMAVDATCTNCDASHRRNTRYTACCDAPSLLVKVRRERKPHTEMRDGALVVLFVVPPGMVYPKVDYEVQYEWSDPATN